MNLASKLVRAKVTVSSTVVRRFVVGGESALLGMVADRACLYRQGQISSLGYGRLGRVPWFHRRSEMSQTMENVVPEPGCARRGRWSRYRPGYGGQYWPASNHHVSLSYVGHFQEYRRLPSGCHRRLTSAVYGHTIFSGCASSTLPRRLGRLAERIPELVLI